MSETLSAPSISHHDLQSLVGLLQFASNVIKPGRPFLRRFHDALSHPVLFHNIDRGLRTDLRWWVALLLQFNGVCLRQIAAPRQDYYFWSDASGTKGFGSYLLIAPDAPPTLQFTVSSPFWSSTKKRDIQFKEMFAVLDGILRWRETLTNQRLHIYDDNNAVVWGLRKLSIHGKAMMLLRHIALILAQSNIEISTTWIDSKSNSLADHLSRFRFGLIANRYPQLKGITPSRPISHGNPLRIGLRM